jgi:hypothetical protein
VTETVEQPSDLINHDETFYFIYDQHSTEYGVYECRLTNANDDSDGFMNRKMLPEFHTINSFYAYTPVCKLTCSENNVSMYNPMKYVQYDYANKVYNEQFISNKKDYTLKDVFPSEWFYGDKLACDLYGHKYSNDVELFDKQKAYYKTLGRSRMLQLISDYDSNAEPVILNGSDAEYTDDMLSDYIIERTHYLGSDAVLITDKNTPYTSVKYIGGYVDIVDKYDNILTNNNGDEIESFPTSIYSIDFIHDISTLNNFRMYDDNDNDISRYCILLIHNKLYTFIDNKWVNVRTREG